MPIGQAPTAESRHGGEWTIGPDEGTSEWTTGPNGRMGDAAARTIRPLITPHSHEEPPPPYFARLIQASQRTMSDRVCTPPRVYRVLYEQTVSTHNVRPCVYTTARVPRLKASPS